MKQLVGFFHDVPLCLFLLFSQFFGCCWDFITPDFLLVLKLFFDSGGPEQCSSFPLLFEFDLLPYVLTMVEWEEHGVFSQVKLVAVLGLLLTGYMTASRQYHLFQPQYTHQ